MFIITDKSTGKGITEIGVSCYERVKVKIGGLKDSNVRGPTCGPRTGNMMIYFDVLKRHTVFYFHQNKKKVRTEGNNFTLQL